MSCVHFVGGEKGGVGKSVLARLLCQWFIDHEVNLSAFDADPAQGALIGAYTQWCQTVDLSEFESADQIMDRALSAQHQVVVDLPAKSHRPLLRWLREGDVFALAQERGVKLVFWLVTDGGFASVSVLENILPQLPASAELVLVRNHRWSLDFTQLEGSDVLRERDGSMMSLSSLDPRIMYKLEGQGVSLSEALHESQEAEQPDEDDEAILTLMERRRLGCWLGEAFSQITPIVQSFLLMAEAEIGTKTELETEVSADPTVEISAGPVDDNGSSSETTSDTAQLAVGSKRIDGARTWTEVGEDCQIHHVRYR